MSEIKSSTQTTRLLLVRHAESVANAEHRIQGRGDDPLSPRGERQAQHLAQWLHRSGFQADVLVASPQRRAHQTASAIGEMLGLTVLVRSGLREMDLGVLEGESIDIWASRDTASPEPIQGAEHPRDFAERALGTLHGLLAAYEGNTLVVVAHGGIISTALAYWIERNVSQWRLYTATRNTAVSELVFGHQIELIRYNDIGHLSEIDPGA